MTDKFAIEIETQRLYPPSPQDYIIKVTHNGYQWSGITCTFPEIEKLRDALTTFLNDENAAPESV